MTLRAPAAWIRVALAMFAVGWGANQFSPMLIVYRQALGLGAAEIAGLFAIYAATLIPGLLAGGPLSDRFGRRACVLPFAALSPVATLLLILGPHDLALIAAGRALAGAVLGHGVRPGDRLGAGPVRRERAERAPRGARAERRVRVRPHRGGGARAVGGRIRWSCLTCRIWCWASWRSPRSGPCRMSGGRECRRQPRPARRWAAPAALRTRAFWLTVAPAAPFVFGSMSMAIVVLPEEVTSASTLSAAFAGLMTALAFAAGIGVQPAARILAERSDRLGILAGTGAAAAGAAVSAVAVAGPDRVLAGLGAVLLGLAYGLCLVCGLHQAEQLSDATDRGAVLSCYYVLAYLGFSAPYVMDGLNEVFGKPGTFAVLAVAAAALTGLLAVGAARGRPAVTGEPQAAHTWDHARS